MSLRARGSWRSDFQLILPNSSWFHLIVGGVCGVGGGRSEREGADPHFDVLQMLPNRQLFGDGLVGERRKTARRDAASPLFVPLRRENRRDVPTGAVGMSSERHANEIKRN